MAASLGFGPPYLFGGGGSAGGFTCRAGTPPPPLSPGPPQPTPMVNKRNTQLGAGGTQICFCFWPWRTGAQNPLPRLPPICGEWRKGICGHLWDSYVFTLFVCGMQKGFTSTKKWDAH